MDDKKIKKLKRLLVVTVILLVGIVVLDIFIDKSKSNISITSPDKDNNEIKTDGTINVAEIDSGRFIKDYTNPSYEELIKAYDMYGYGNCYFTDEGLFVKAGEYDDSEDRLITNVWLSGDAFVSKVKEPQIGSLDTIEIGETYLKIFLIDVTEKELKEYIKEIKDEYSEKIDTYNNWILYLAKNDEGNKIEIRHNSKRSSASILYEF